MKRVNITSKVLSFFECSPHCSFCQKITVHVGYQVQLRFARTGIEAELENLNQNASQKVVAKVFISTMSLFCVVLSFYFEFLNFVLFCLKVRNWQDAIFQATFTLAVPDSAYVSAFSVEVGGRLFEARIGPSDEGAEYFW